MARTDSRLAHSPEPASHDAASPIDLRTQAGTPAGTEELSLVPATGAWTRAGGGADRPAFEPVPLRHRHDGLTPLKQREFVEALADCGLVREAAARVGLSEQAINRVRRRADAVSFDRACEAAHRSGARRLRSIAFERAIEGTLKGHYYHGELVGQERVFDNRLLIYLLGKTEHLLEPSEESRAICEQWEPYMEALEQGLPTPELVPPDPEEVDRQIEEAEDPQVWCDEDGTWWTFFPPPEGFEGEENGDVGEHDYQRTLTAEEAEAMEARDRKTDEAEIALSCAVRDRWFGLPPRGHSGFFLPMGSRNNEPSDPHPSHPGEGRDLGETDRDHKARDPGFLRDDESPP